MAEMNRATRLSCRVNRQIVTVQPKTFQMDEFDEFDEFDEELLLAAVEQVEVKNLIPRQSAPTVPAVVKQAVVKQKTMADFGFVKRAEPSLGIEVEGRATNPVRQSAIESHHKVDQNALKSWIYPINYPLREYQFNIAQFSLFSNTLVCLPTGYISF